MKKYSFLMCIIFVASFFFVGSVQTGEAKGNGISSQAIFDYAGHEKPDDWGVWEQEQKHAYYQSLGLYPASGNKYQGEFDVDRYFETLGVDQPENWDTLSPQERQEFVKQVNLGAVEGDRQPTEDSEEKQVERQKEDGVRDNDVMKEVVQPPQDDSASFPLWLQLLLFGTVGAAIIGAKSLIGRK